MNMIDMDAWKSYYSDINNLDKIANECKYREVVIIRPVMNKKITLRPLKIFKTEHLQFWIERLKLTENTFDLYICQTCYDNRIKEEQADQETIEPSHELKGAIDTKKSFWKRLMSEDYK